MPSVSAEDFKSRCDEIIAGVQCFSELQKIFGWEYLQLFASAASESDRGAVLIMHSAIDDALQELILGFLKRQAPDAEGDQVWLVSFEKSPVPPLGGFGVKTRFCYAAGLIDKNLKSNLVRLGKIRNPFAHAWNQSVRLQREHMDSLLAMVDDDEFREFVANLQNKNEKDVNRLKMIFIGFFILNKLFIRIHQVTGSLPVRLPQRDQKHGSTQSSEPRSEVPPTGP